MRYAIIVNPASGRLSIDRKRAALKPAAAVLNAPIHGLDTTCIEEFTQCARDTAKTCDVLVVAGGDGTFSDVINAVDTSRMPVAYLPLGSGNALRYALGYRGSLEDIARRIRSGPIRSYDLIDIDGKRKGFMASVGFDAEVIRLRDRYRRLGVTGLSAYALAGIQAWVKTYRPCGATVTLDSTTVQVRNLMTLLVTKQPYFGYGLKVMPKARFDDGKLHVTWTTLGTVRFASGVVGSWRSGDRLGRHWGVQKVRMESERAVPIQIDGNLAWAAGCYMFDCFEKSLCIKC